MLDWITQTLLNIALPPYAPHPPANNYNNVVNSGAENALAIALNRDPGDIVDGSDGERVLYAIDNTLNWSTTFEFDWRNLSSPSFPSILDLSEEADVQTLNILVNAKFSTGNEPLLRITLEKGSDDPPQRTIVKQFSDIQITNTGTTLQNIALPWSISNLDPQDHFFIKIESINSTNETDISAVQVFNIEWATVYDQAWIWTSIGSTVLSGAADIVIDYVIEPALETDTNVLIKDETSGTVTVDGDHLIDGTFQFVEEYAIGISSFSIYNIQGASIISGSVITIGAQDYTVSSVTTGVPDTAITIDTPLVVLAEAHASTNYVTPVISITVVQSTPLLLSSTTVTINEQLYSMTVNGLVLTITSALLADLTDGTEIEFHTPNITLTGMDLTATRPPGDTIEKYIVERLQTNIVDLEDFSMIPIIQPTERTTGFTNRDWSLDANMDLPSSDLADTQYLELIIGSEVPYKYKRKSGTCKLKGNYFAAGKFRTDGDVLEGATTMSKRQTFLGDVRINATFGHTLDTRETYTVISVNLNTFTFSPPLLIGVPNGTFLFMKNINVPIIVNAVSNIEVLKNSLELYSEAINIVRNFEGFVGAIKSVTQETGTAKINGDSNSNEIVIDTIVGASISLETIIIIDNQHYIILSIDSNVLTLDSSVTVVDNENISFYNATTIQLYAYSGNILDGTELFYTTYANYSQFLNPIMNIEIYQGATLLGSHTVVPDSNARINNSGGYSSGATEITYDNLSGTIAEGMYIFSPRNIYAHDPRDREVYTITNDTGTVITIEPPLVTSINDNQKIYFTSNINRVPYNPQLLRIPFTKPTDEINIQISALTELDGNTAWSYTLEVLSADIGDTRIFIDPDALISINPNVYENLDGIKSQATLIYNDGIRYEVLEVGSNYLDIYPPLQTSVTNFIDIDYLSLGSVPELYSINWKPTLTAQDEILLLTSDPVTHVNHIVKPNTGSIIASGSAIITSNYTIEPSGGMVITAVDIIFSSFDNDLTFLATIEIDWGTEIKKYSNSEFGNTIAYLKDLSSINYSLQADGFGAVKEITLLFDDLYGHFRHKMNTVDFFKKSITAKITIEVPEKSLLTIFVGHLKDPIFIEQDKTFQVTILSEALTVDALYSPVSTDVTGDLIPYRDLINREAWPEIFGNVTSLKPVPLLQSIPMVTLLEDKDVSEDGAFNLPIETSGFDLVPAEGNLQMGVSVNGFLIGTAGTRWVVDQETPLQIIFWKNKENILIPVSFVFDGEYIRGTYDPILKERLHASIGLTQNFKGTSYELATDAYLNGLYCNLFVRNPSLFDQTFLHEKVLAQNERQIELTRGVFINEAADDTRIPDSLKNIKQHRGFLRILHKGSTIIADTGNIYVVDSKNLTVVDRVYIMEEDGPKVLTEGVDYTVEHGLFGRECTYISITRIGITKALKHQLDGTVFDGFLVDATSLVNTSYKAMKYLVEEYSDYTWDTNNGIKGSNVSFALTEQNNLADAVADIAWQDRKAIKITNGKAVTIVDLTSNSGKIKLDDTNIEINTTQQKYTKEEDLITRIEVDYTLIDLLDIQSLITEQDIKYQENILDIDIYIHKTKSEVQTVANFWKSRLSNPRKEVILNLPIDYMGINIWDRVNLQMSAYEFSNEAGRLSNFESATPDQWSGLGWVQEVNLDLSNFVVNIRIRLD